jgi:hypothetical protein
MSNAAAEPIMPEPMTRSFTLHLMLFSNSSLYAFGANGRQ